MMVDDGLAPPPVGNRDPSQIQRFGTSHVRPFVSVTLSEGVNPIRHPPIRCAMSFSSRGCVCRRHPAFAACERRGDWLPQGWTILLGGRSISGRRIRGTCPSVSGTYSRWSEASRRESSRPSLCCVDGADVQTDSFQPVVGGTREWFIFSPRRSRYGSSERSRASHRGVAQQTGAQGFSSRAIACKPPRHHWHLRHRRHHRICNLQKVRVGFESHPLRHLRSLPLAR